MSEELIKQIKIIASDYRWDEFENIQTPHCRLNKKMIAQLVELFAAQTSKDKALAVVEAKIQMIDSVFELSPKGSFNNWKPIDALRFYERLKETERQLNEERKKLLGSDPDDLLDVQQKEKHNDQNKQS